MLVDSHCHLDRLDYEKKHHDLADVLNKAQQRGVSHFLSVSVTLDAFPSMLQSVLPYPNVFASCGVHPLDLDSGWSGELLRELAVHPRVIALGETGLDYHWDDSKKEAQKHSFAEHIYASQSIKKPIIVHTRNAYHDTLDLLKAEQCEHGIIHCFTEDYAFAKTALDMGLYISFSGIVSFNKSQDLRDVAKKLPLDRILIETDSPYLAPVPKRGRDNEPTFVPYVAKALADIFHKTAEEMGEITSANFDQLLNQYH